MFVTKQTNKKFTDNSHTRFPNTSSSFSRLHPKFIFGIHYNNMLSRNTIQQPSFLAIVTIRRIWITALVVQMIVSLLIHVNSFGIHHQQQLLLNPSKVRRRNAQTVYVKNDLFTDISVPFRTDGAHSTLIPTTAIVKDAHQVLDKNGNEFTVDCIVRVAIDGLKAYHINTKGQGSYNEKKEFIQDTSDTKKKCLQLPIGLRGVVTKVYDENIISSNLPIVVLFTPGAYVEEEGYNPPTKFYMHFTPYEVEVVV